MSALEIQSKDILCPYCGESINIDVDCSVENQNYIEDCQVCCRPIVFDVVIGEDAAASISVRTENE